MSQPAPQPGPPPPPPPIRLSERVRLVEEALDDLAEHDPDVLRELLVRSGFIR